MEVGVDHDLVVAVRAVGHAGEVAPGPDRAGRARRGGGFAREIRMLGAAFRRSLRVEERKLAHVTQELKEIMRERG